MNEAELMKLRSQVREADARAASLRAEADSTASRMRDAGADMTAADNFAVIDEAYKGADAARDEAAVLRARAERGMEIAVGAREPRTRDEANVAKDMTSRLRASAGYQNMANNGSMLSGSALGTVGFGEVATRDEFMRDALRVRTTFDNSSNIGSGLLVPDYTGNVIDVLIRRVRLLDLITVGSTDTDTVDWIVEQARTDAAAETAYGTAVPESAYGFAHTTTSVKRVGHYIPATKGVLMDAGQTKTLLDARLISGLQLRLETQMFGGNGTGENLKGFSGESGILTQALGTDTQIDAVHKAITAIRVANSMQVEPTVLLISPADYEKVLLQKTSQGAYIYANPTAGGNPTIWGLMPVVTPLVADGTPWVGDWKEACTAWVRTGVSLSASDQHSDYFTRGLVALMAETRLAFKTTRPSALAKVTGF